MTKRTIALLLALALGLGACGAPPPETSQSEPPPEATLSSPEPQPETEARLSEVEALVQEIIMTYGGEIVPRKSARPQLRRKSDCLFDIRYSWHEPEELDTSDYYVWFFSTTLEEDDAYRREHYTHPQKPDKWFFPQEVFEERVQTYFDVSTEHLRRGSEYDPELEGYWSDSAAPCGSEEAAIAYTYTRNGPRLIIDLDLDYEYGTILAERFRLSVLLEEDGGWKYLGCQCRPNELPVDGVTWAERERYLPLTPEQWALIDRAEELVPMFQLSTDLVLEGETAGIDFSGAVEINGRPGYLPYTGTRYRDWDDFQAQMLDVFTEDFYRDLNRSGPFAEYEGKLYFQDAARGSDITYLREEDRFSAMAADDWVRVTRYAYYSAGGEAREPVSVRAMPILLKKTENGWRVDRFTLPY